MSTHIPFHKVYTRQSKSPWVDRARAPCVTIPVVSNFLRRGEPVYAKRQALSKIKEFEELLISWLKREARRRRKARKTVKNLYEDLLPLGYSGSYDRVAAFVRKWREEQRLTASNQANP